MSQSNYHSGQCEEECHFCGDSDVEEHHVIPQRFGGPDAPENIVDVCSDCHKKLERLYDKSFYEWFGIDDEQGERYYHRECFMSGCERTAARIAVLSDTYSGKEEKAPESYRFPICNECLARRVKEERDAEGTLQSTGAPEPLSAAELGEMMDNKTVDSSAAAGVPEHTLQ